MKKLVRIPLFLVGAAATFFVVTFTMYIFNLDMKTTALVAPLLEKHYDNLERKQYI